MGQTTIRKARIEEEASVYRKILVPLDGSALSESVLEHVVAIASGCKVPEVVLMRVRQSLDETVTNTIDFEIASKLDEAYQEEAVNNLEQVATGLKEKGLLANTIVLTGKPAEEILNYAQSSGVDLIIMSTHGRSGVSRWVLGSVADKVVRHSTVPVLIRSALTQVP
jgi:nucleotide-binding universal stress UspA family protein